MSALTDLFTAMANKIRSKTGTQTTYTPTEMASDGIDDVYDAGVASVPTPTSITPSNSSPVSLTANTAVKPTAAGVAIESYSSITPSDTLPVTLSNGSIYKMNGAGKAVESCTTKEVYASTVETLSVGIYKIVKGDTAVIPKITGKVISNVTPSNSSPVQLYAANVLYSMTAGGYAISSYSNKTPSDSNPPSVASGDIVKMGGAGYLVENAPIDMTNPDVTWEGNLAANGSKTIAVTQKPRLVISSTSRYGDTNGNFVFRVNDVANDKNCNAYYGSSYVENLNSSGLTGVTASNTSVVFSSNRSYTTRNAVFIWY